jgi:hypothetical protein
MAAKNKDEDKKKGTKIGGIALFFFSQERNASMSWKGARRPAS